MLFAASDAFWLALFGLLTIVVKEVFDWLRARRTTAAVKAVGVKAARAAKRAGVAAKTSVAVSRQTVAQNEVLGVIQEQTNGALEAARAEIAALKTELATERAARPATRLQQPPE